MISKMKFLSIEVELEQYLLRKDKPISKVVKDESVCSCCGGVHGDEDLCDNSDYEEEEDSDY
jgi:hypothetical protein